MTYQQKVGWVKFWTPKDDWYYISNDERQTYLTAYAKAVDEAKTTGAERVGTYKCRGQSEWMRFEVWEFAKLEDVIQFTRVLESIGHYQYFEEDNTVGRKYEKSGEIDSWMI